MTHDVEIGNYRAISQGYKRVKKRSYDMKLLEAVINCLLKEQKLDACYQDHGLIGNYMGFRECHILPDWLLIYAKDKEKLILTISRAEIHSDLFAK